MVNLTDYMRIREKEINTRTNNLILNEKKPSVINNNNNNNKLYLHDCKFVTILQKRKLIK